jgi:flagella basal body P-ring formation protein FlgA
MAFIPFLAMCFIILGTKGYSSGSDLTTIAFLKKAEVTEDTVQLGDIADIKGGNQAFLQRLRTLVIGKSPLPGKSCEIKGAYVKTRLKHNDIPLSQVIFRNEAKIEVSRSFIEVHEKEIEKIVYDFIYGNAPWDRNKMRVTNIRVAKQIILPEGHVTYTVSPLHHSDLLGTEVLPIIFKVDGTVQKKMWATVDIALFGEVVVTKKPLGRYQVITEDDIQLQEVDMAQVPSTVVTSCEEVLGKRTKRAINANVVLKNNLIELPPLVKRGDIVKIIAQSDTLKISAIGEIKQKGHRGERVRVENLGSRKEIYARVVDSQCVKVDF